jgi:hypothetical protein
MSSRRTNRTREVRRVATIVSLVSFGASPWLRGLLLLALSTGVADPDTADAYDVCSDENSPCTHEVMTEQGLDLYYFEAAQRPYAQEIKDNWDSIKKGVANPDQYDPLYDNTGLGDALVTISHFWDPDDSLGAPMEFDDLADNDYPNAFNAAQALWTRALGEYAGGNKELAYQYLGMVAHFLGDQTIPTHAHNDTHGPDILDDDAYEEWMSRPALGGGDSPNAFLTAAELFGLRALGILDNPRSEIDEQLLWLFLNVNQVADYFASDDVHGDDDHPSDPFYPWADDFAQPALDRVKTLCDAEPNGCPTTKERLVDNDLLNIDLDGDLSLIRKHSYVPGLRAMGALFALWEEAIRKPVLTLTVHRIEEVGFTGALVCAFGTLGLDDCNRPDYFVGMVMGYNERTCVDGDCPEPVGGYLESRNGLFRNVDGVRFPGNVTRTDANGVYEDETVITPDYHFGQVYSVGEGGYVSDEDVVHLTLSVWDQDTTEFYNPPYSSDDVARVRPGGGKDLDIRIDLAKCLSGAEDAVMVETESRSARCALSTDPDAESETRIAIAGGTGGDSDDVKVVFSVAMVQADDSPPEISCAAADGVWHATDLSIACTAVDGGAGLANLGDVDFSLGAGLANLGDVDFSLSTSVPSGTETSNAVTGTRVVCDAVGNCATAGPVTGNRVDKRAPEIGCDAADGVWYATDVSPGCTAVDGGAGLAKGAGLANLGDVDFSLSTSVPSGTETSNAVTGTRVVCDAVGNCATAGPITGNKIDKKAPVITVVQPETAEYVHSATLVLDYTVTDGGSGVSTVSPTMNGSAEVAGSSLPNGRAIHLLTSLPLGPSVFSVDAVDRMGNASSPASTTFTIIVTPRSMIEDVNQFGESGAIGQTLRRSLLAKLRNAMAAVNRGQCGPAGNLYGAFIHEVEAQSGKKIEPMAAAILIADTEYLIANCSAAGRSASRSKCGLGFEAALLLPPLMLLRRKKRA